MSNITRLQERCTTCSKPAIEKKSFYITVKDESKPDEKYVFLECGHLIVYKIPKGTRFDSLISNWWDTNKPPCNHVWSKDDYKECELCGETRLYEFQCEGAKFIETGLATNKGGAVFDEMGLGKTVQALAYLRFHPEAFPVVYVVKKKIKYQWFREALKWLGPQYGAQVINSSTDYIIPQMKGYIVTYDAFVFKTKTSKKTGKTTTFGLDYSKFDHCKTVVLDECQQIKNDEAERTKQIRRLVKDKKVIPLSGTPWKNRGGEFYPVLNMLDPYRFSSPSRFIREWVDSFWNGGYEKQEGIRKIAEFKEYTKDIIIRREIADVGIQMPDVSRMPYLTELDGSYQSRYDDEESEFVRWFNERIINGEDDDAFGDMHILAKMAKMRHITGLAKIDATLEWAEEFAHETDRKLVIFIHHKDVGDILYRKLKAQHPDIPVYHMTAELGPMESNQLAERFQNAPRAFMVASTLSSGEGINLQSCADAIMHERQWNPQNEDQAAPGRFRRIGSKHKRVNVTFMTAAGTIDEILAGIVENKRIMFHQLMNKGDMPPWSEAGLAKELAQGIVNAFNKSGKSLTKMASL